MKIVLKTENPPPKLMAVIGVSGTDFFVRGVDNTSLFISASGNTMPRQQSLEDLLQGNSGRKAVYEGDTLEITL